MAELSRRTSGAIVGPFRFAKRSSDIPSLVTTKAACPSSEKTTALGLNPTVTVKALSPDAARVTSETSW